MSLDDEADGQAGPVRPDERRRAQRDERRPGPLKPATGWKGRLIQAAGFALYLCGGEASVGVTRTQASTIDTSGVSGPEVFHAGLDDAAGSLGLSTGQAERVSASLGIPTLGRTVAVFEKEATTWLGISGESLQGLDLESLAHDHETRCAVIKPDFTDLACWSEDPELLVTLDKNTRRAIDRSLGAADEVHGQSFAASSSASDLAPAPATPLDEVAGEEKRRGAARRSQLGTRCRR